MVICTINNKLLTSIEIEIDLDLRTHCTVLDPDKQNMMVGQL